MNKTFLAGRLVDNPISFATQTNTPNSRFNLAVNDSQNNNETYFLPCICWSNRATYVNSYLKKGDYVIVEGRITRKKYLTKDGKNAYSMDIVVDNIRLVTSANNTRNSNVAQKVNVDNFSTSKVNENEEFASLNESFENKVNLNTTFDEQKITTDSIAKKDNNSGLENDLEEDSEDDLLSYVDSLSNN